MGAGVSHELRSRLSHPHPGPPRKGEGEEISASIKGPPHVEAEPRLRREGEGEELNASIETGKPLSLPQANGSEPMTFAGVNYLAILLASVASSLSVL